VARRSTIACERLAGKKVEVDSDRDGEAVQAGRGFILATSIRGPSVVVRLLCKNIVIGLGALVACCALAAPSLAAPDGQAPDARTLGVTEAMLDYCTKAYPASADKFQFQIKRLIQGASQETLAKVRSSEQYRRAHDAEVDFVSKVDPRNAKRTCSKPLVAHKRTAGASNASSVHD
jgi:hypothetical protein